MVLAQGPCAQGTHAHVQTRAHCLSGSLGCPLPQCPLLGSTGISSVSSLDARPCLVSWSQHRGGAESTDSFQLPPGQMTAMLSGQQLPRGQTLWTLH